MFRRLLRYHIVLGAGGVILLIFFFTIGWLRPLEYLLSYTFFPLQTRAYALGVRLRALPLFHWKEFSTLRQMIEVEHRERVRLAEENSRLQFAADENEALRRMLGFRDSMQYEMRAARVYGRSREPGSAVLFIDRGADDGLRVGMPVIVADGVFIGKIFKVDHTSAQVLLPSDPRFRAAVTFTNAVKTSGLARGDGGVSVFIDLIPRDFALAKGDVVVTSGIEAEIPRGLVLGFIDAVLPAQERLFQRAALQSATNFSRISDVAVLFSGE